MRRVVIWVEGTVQGVGFRWWVSRQAGRLGLAGSAENLRDGRVEIDVQGPDADVAALIEAVTGRPGPAGRPGYVSRWLVENRTVDPRLEGFSAR